MNGAQVFEAALIVPAWTAAHCGFYPMSGRTVADFADDLEGFDWSKGTIRFQPGKPLPVVLVKKLVKARIAENESRGMSARTSSRTGARARTSKAQR